MHIKRSDTLGLILFTLTTMGFPFLFMSKPTPVWPLCALEWYSKWPLCKVMKYLSGILTLEIPITSHTNQVSLRSSSSSFMYSYLVEFWRCRSLSLVYLPSFGGSF